MSAGGVGGVGGAGNGTVPGFQEGGMSQSAIDKMGDDQLINLAKNGSEIDKKNAAAELKERIEGGGKGGKCGGAGGGGDVGGGDEVDDEIKKILEKLMRGEKLTPQEEEKLKAALSGEQKQDDPGV